MDDIPNMENSKEVVDPINWTGLAWGVGWTLALLLVLFIVAVAYCCRKYNRKKRSIESDTRNSTYRAFASPFVNNLNCLEHDEEAPCWNPSPSPQTAPPPSPASVTTAGSGVKLTVAESSLSTKSARSQECSTAEGTKVTLYSMNLMSTNPVVVTTHVPFKGGSRVSTLPRKPPHETGSTPVSPGMQCKKVLPTGIVTKAGVRNDQLVTMRVNMDMETNSQDLDQADLVEAQYESCMDESTDSFKSTYEVGEGGEGSVIVKPGFSRSPGGVEEESVQGHNASQLSLLPLTGSPSLFHHKRSPSLLFNSESPSHLPEGGNNALLPDVVNPLPDRESPSLLPHGWSPSLLPHGVSPSLSRGSHSFSAGEQTVISVQGINTQHSDQSSEDSVLSDNVFTQESLAFTIYQDSPETQEEREQEMGKREQEKVTEEQQKDSESNIMSDIVTGSSLHISGLTANNRLNTPAFLSDSTARQDRSMDRLQFPHLSTSMEFGVGASASPLCSSTGYSPVYKLEFAMPSPRPSTNPRLYSQNNQFSGIKPLPPVPGSDVQILVSDEASENTSKVPLLAGLLNQSSSLVEVSNTTPLSAKVTDIKLHLDGFSNQPPVLGEGAGLEIADDSICGADDIKTVSFPLLITSQPPFSRSAVEVRTLPAKTSGRGASHTELEVGGDVCQQPALPTDQMKPMLDPRSQEFEVKTFRKDDPNSLKARLFHRGLRRHEGARMSNDHSIGNPTYSNKLKKPLEDNSSDLAMHKENRIHSNTDAIDSLNSTASEDSIRSGEGKQFATNSKSCNTPNITIDQEPSSEGNSLPKPNISNECITNNNNSSMQKNLNLDSGTVPSQEPILVPSQLLITRTPSSPFSSSTSAAKPGRAGPADTPPPPAAAAKKSSMLLGLGGSQDPPLTPYSGQPRTPAQRRLLGAAAGPATPLAWDSSFDNIPTEENTMRLVKTPVIKSSRFESNGSTPSLPGNRLWNDSNQSQDSQGSLDWDDSFDALEASGKKTATIRAPSVDYYTCEEVEEL